jgi:transposase
MPNRKVYPSDLTDAQWEILEPLIPALAEDATHVSYERREIVNGILYVLRSGCPWRLVPHDLPAWGTLYWYFRAWRNEGVWDQIMQTLRRQVRHKQGREEEPSAAVIDSQSIKTSCTGYSGHPFSKSVLERQGIVVVVRQALFKRMSLVASTPSCRQIGASDKCGNMRDEQAGSLSFRADSAHLFTFCAHAVLISTQRRAAWLVSYTLAESPSTKT